MRTALRPATVGRSGVAVAKDLQVWAATLSASFDPNAYDDPREFRTDRPLSGYLHFGFGRHRCFGARINEVTLSEIAASLLALPYLERASKRTIEWDSYRLFPERWVVEIGR